MRGEVLNVKDTQGVARERGDEPSKTTTHQMCHGDKTVLRTTFLKYISKMLSGYLKMSAKNCGILGKI